ncbi:hypothetical protein ARMA_0424 [Ardenticatena maritima]|uniref:Uncharacterized protein n=1 Tax=Ardenticatena maritima TaxID=872965 RepID=A0A0M8K6W0_9CHLR|nr:hypothetical protein [Ardenticatena maritima]GAP62001.1 hypothetical protein ARMA_0424 [Ardenticatena maritima]
MLIHLDDISPVWQVDDVVRARQGVADPDLDVDVSGWQGRIIEVLPEERLACVAWDSHTLRNMPARMIEECEENGMDWRTMYLAFEDLERAEPRDTEADVAATIAELERRHAWAYLGEQGKRIRRILKGIDPTDIEAALRAWQRFFKQRLRLPLNVVVFEPPPPESGLALDDRVKLRAIRGATPDEGLLAEVEKRRQERVQVPLFILQAAKESSKPAQWLDDYSTWWHNRHRFVVEFD